MIFLTRGGRNRVDARRHRERFALAHQRRRGVLRYHQARLEARPAREEERQSAVFAVEQEERTPLAHAGDCDHPRLEKIARDADRLAVEVAARQEVVFVRKNQRVVGDGSRLDLEDAARVSGCVARRTVNDRDATERIGILNAPAIAVRKHDLRIGEKRTQAIGHEGLTGVRP